MTGRCPNTSRIRLCRWKLAEPLGPGTLRRLCARPGAGSVRRGPGRHTRSTVALAAVALVMLAMIAACGDESADHHAVAGAGTQNVAVVTDVDLSAAAQAGQSVFAANCAACHGADVGGTGLGPPLIHRIYEPGHHPDQAIRLAVLSGVRQHHWSFGDMPAAAGVSAAEIEQVICFIREMQFANQVFTNPAHLPDC